MLLFVLVHRFLCADQNELFDSRKSIAAYADVRMLMIFAYLSEVDPKDIVDRQRKFSHPETEDKYTELIESIERLADGLNISIVETKQKLESLKDNGSFYIASIYLKKLHEDINNAEAKEQQKDIKKLVTDFINTNFLDVEEGCNLDLVKRNDKTPDCANIYTNGDKELVPNVIGSCSETIEQCTPNKDEEKRLERDSIKSKDVNEEHLNADLNVEKVYNNLVKKWEDFYREISINFDESKSTLIKLKHPFTIPGGRFREVYYWDSYWIMRGLLLCNKKTQAHNCLINFKDLINTYGMIPNGTRKYYLGRSQPPMFIQMISDYIKDLPLDEKRKFLDEGGFLQSAQKEYDFWMKYRSVNYLKNDKNYILNQYKVHTDYPRPESLKSDIDNFGEKIARRGQTPLVQKELPETDYDQILSPSKDLVDLENNFYGHIKAAAESGWDFSSRWFCDHKSISSCCTNNIIPPCLNAIMYKNEVLLSEFYEIIGYSKKSGEYIDKANNRQKAINAVLWCGEAWLDLDIIKKEHIKSGYYFSNVMPLFYGIEPPIGHSCWSVLRKYKNFLFYCKGGVPASETYLSHQQWDYPNVWAPHQEMLVTFLLKKNERSLALQVAQSFYSSVYGNIKRTARNDEISGEMRFYEKYNCCDCSKAGGHGEYNVQEGFGWTNGVTLLFLKMFGNELTRDEKSFLNGCRIVESILNEKCIEKKQTDLNNNGNAGIYRLPTLKS